MTDRLLQRAMTIFASTTFLYIGSTELAESGLNVTGVLGVLTGVTFAATLLGGDGDSD